ncbi:PX domain-containing protein kinase-like protein [Coccinella septempunctata]|uniref:PX domain-containing protein kinase-like protein n=1 Tax=Coccinella septempunctata TaxID=41139 RepID=UPI001D086C22|nr:PX domain-containing protein kinase-like protein [Coccinella septempunctata]
MAIFEKETSNKVLLDDTEPLSCTIENWKSVNGHTEFIIKVHRGPFSDETWRISKRYNDFYKLHTHLQSSGLQLSFPPKKLIGNFDPDFINERLRGLQKYLNLILMNPILVSSLPARSFIDPANYCQPFSEVALQHVSLALRGEVGWEVATPLTEIGWRIRKHYYHLKNKNAPSREFWASWTDFGPDKYLDDKDMHSFFKSLSQLQHPFIHPVEMCLCNDVGGLVVRTYQKDGTLRDLLCNSKPKQSFLKKYGNPKGHKHLGESQIALYGRQILEALSFMHDKGIPYGHLHTGNVVIENGRVKLLDIENGVLGVPSFYRPYFMQHRKISSLEAIDVYCFGHTLYEMTFGAPLHESIVENFPDCAPPIKAVLQSILSFDACKSGLPSIDDLLNQPFFSSATTNATNNEKIFFKLPSSTKEKLKLVRNQIENRLKDEQKMVRSQKRLVKVQEMMSSEEEKKKQRHKQRHEQKLFVKEQQKKQEKLRQQSIDGEKAHSGNSSTATSVGTATPPSTGSHVPSPPPPPPPPPMLSNGEVLEHPISPPEFAADDRSALLGAICNFNKSSLRKSQTKK